MHAGLDIKVAFGDVWKESLTELSGGQRSLLALSLILAMLLFKPAPIYILDEVRQPVKSAMLACLGRLVPPSGIAASVEPFRGEAGLDCKLSTTCMKE